MTRMGMSGMIAMTAIVGTGLSIKAARVAGVQGRQLLFELTKMGSGGVSINIELINEKNFHEGTARMRCSSDKVLRRRRI